MYRNIRSVVKSRSVKKHDRRVLEALEQRCMLDGGAIEIVDDVVSAYQNDFTPQVISVLDNDQFDEDYNGPQEITSISYGSQGGSVSISDDSKSIVYMPPADFAGSEVFSYFVDNVAFASVTVNIAPALESDEYTIPPDGIQRTLNVLDNDPFWEGYDGSRRITSISETSQGSNIQISSDGKSIEYTPPADGQGRDRFLYIVDEIYPASVVIDVPQTLERDDFELIQNDVGVKLNVLANDPFWPTYNRDKIITHVLDVNHGEATIAEDGKSILYTPAQDFYGWDSLRYVVDGEFESYASVVIHRPVNDDRFEVDYNSTHHRLNLTSNDYFYARNNIRRDVVDRITSVEPSENGSTVTISPDGQSVIYSAPADFAGQDTFTYVADEKYPATVRVNVTRPVRNDHFRSDLVFQDTPDTHLPVLDNDFIGNGYQGARQITSVSTDETNGTVEIRNNRIFYTPADGFSGYDSFTYTVDNELDALASFHVTPLAQANYTHACVNNFPNPYTYDVLSNDYFHRGYSGRGIITELSNLAEGLSAEIIDGGRAVEVHWNSTDYQFFDYTVDGKYTATASLSLRNHTRGDQFVTDQNTDSGPLFVLENDFRYNNPHDTCRSSNYRGNRRITAVSETEQGGTVTISADGRFVEYQPPADFIGADTFSYSVDGIMQSSVTMNVIRRVRDDHYRVAVDANEELPLLLNDLLGADYRGAGQITEITGDSAADIQITPDGKSVTYQPGDDFRGDDVFGYTVDGKHKATVTVSVRDDGADFDKFESLDEYSQFLLDDASTRYQYLFGNPYYHWFGFDDFDGPGLFDHGEAAGPPRDHSETNVQVEGVDEGDIVEFDSDYLYSLAGQELVIMSAYPGDEIDVVSRTLIEGVPEAEFLKGDRLTVISTLTEYIDPNPEDDGDPGDPDVDFPEPGLIDCAFDCFSPWPSYQVEYSTIVTVFDVSDRSSPQVVQKSSMEGQFVESRGIGDYVYLAVNNTAVAPEPMVITETDEDGNEHKRYETEEEYLSRFTANPGDLIEAALPNYTSLDSSGEIARTGLLNSPEEIYKPISNDASNLLSIVSININNSEPGLAAASGVYTLGGSIVYASLDNFYVFENEYDTTGEDGNITRIHKFDWESSTGDVTFVSATYVPGRMINQFSADEYEGHLRIATTVSNRSSGNWTNRDENTLFVLREDEGTLELVGSMHNLALNETLRSVRFMGERAFAVTFRDIDPLFGFDLSDHHAPVSVGAVPIPGVLEYMQFATPNILMTVGKSTPDGFNGPAQVSLFDVTTLNAPRLIDQHTFDRFSTTEAAVDHHAFGYFSRLGLLALPSTRGFRQRVDEDGDGFKETSEWVNEYELLVFEVDTTVTGRNDAGLTLVGTIEHESQVRRSGYVGEYLYSVANDSVHSMRVDDPQTVVGTVADLTQVEVQQEFPDIIWPFVDFAAGAFDVAADDLADRLGIEAGAVVHVAAEPDADGEKVVLRVGESYYLYRATEDGEVEFVESDFGFVDDIAWQNPIDSNDINGDGEVSPNDAILIINRLNNPGASRALPDSVVRQVTGANGEHYFFDANDDGQISPADAIRVINRLNELSMIRTDPVQVDEDASDEAAANLFSQVRDLIGDSNLDGRFDSADLVQVFQAAEYEDATEDNSTWAEGDWDGDRDFTTSDFVAAFQAGSYVAAATSTSQPEHLALVDEAFSDAGELDDLI